MFYALGFLQSPWCIGPAAISTTMDVPLYCEDSLVPPKTVPSMEASTVLQSELPSATPGNKQNLHSQVANPTDPSPDPWVAFLTQPKYGHIGVPTQGREPGHHIQPYHPPATASATNLSDTGYPLKGRQSLPVIEQPLMRENYKEKFRALLLSEEKSHSQILEEKLVNSMLR